MNNFLLVLLGIVTSSLAQIMLKKSCGFSFLKEFNFFMYFILGGLFYVISFGIYAVVLKIFNLSIISPVMTIGTMLLVVIAGVSMFNEELTTRNILGICLGLVSIILIMVKTT